MTDDHETDAVFAGSVPDIYDEYLVPLIFAPYAEDLASRLSALPCSSILEVAAGTGVVTRALAVRLPESLEITATDLNQAMIDRAIAVGTARPVTWQMADAMSLPFANASFDVVLCQFGVMFFPDKPAAFAEMARVLSPGGALLFNVWDRIETNEFADTVTTSVGRLFPEDPPRFLARTPHGYHDEATIRADLGSGGFAAEALIEAVEVRRLATSSDFPAIAHAYCQGTPLRNEIEARDPARLQEATDTAATALAERFGRTDNGGLLRAFVVTVRKPGLL